jgi:hypothetical protein
VTDVISLNSDSPHACFAVLYQKMDHQMLQGRIQKRVKREVEKHYYD